MGCCVTNDLTDIRCSNDKLISSLFPDGNTSQESSKRMITTATAFKSSLNELVNILLVKVPHYVRCVKSNDRLAPATFDMELCRHQIRYLGLLENVRVRRAGFVFRQPYEKFLARYKILCPRVWPSYNGSAREGTDIILKYRKVETEGYRLGKTKVFIRKPNTLFQLEEEREKELPRCATLIQKIMRKYLARKNYLFMRAAVRIMQFYKKHKARRYLLDIFKAFANVKKSVDLGKSVAWPKVSSSAMVTGTAYLKKMLACWRADQIIGKLSIEQQLRVRQKCVMHRLFLGQKRYELSRVFSGDYLSQ
jgi:myosin-1